MFPDFCYLNLCLHFRTKQMRLFQYMYRYRSYFCSFIICWLEGHPVVINDPAFPAATSSKFIPLAVAKHPCDKNIRSFDTTPQLGDVQTLFSLLDVFFSFFMYGFIYFSLFLNEIWMCLLLRVPGPQSHRLTLCSLMLGRKHYCCYIKHQTPSSTLRYCCFLKHFLHRDDPSQAVWMWSMCVIQYLLMFWWILVLSLYYILYRTSGQLKTLDGIVITLNWSYPLQLFLLQITHSYWFLP